MDQDVAIYAHELRKEFRVPRNREGLWGALLDLFGRRHDRIEAVAGVSFQVRRGEICGYIGENGAGKSTTIKMLTGILVPTSGEVVVNGFVPYRQRQAYVRTIGVVFGQRSQLWWDIGVIESFRLLRKVYRVPEADFRRRLDELTERLGLGELLHRPVRKLSLGQRMRCELAAALLHRPSVLFLDEPTIGLDVVAKAEIREFLLEMNRRDGTTILLTTHDLQDIEALCSRVIMLDGGRIIYDGGLDELKARWGAGRDVVIHFDRPVALAELRALTADVPAAWSADDERTVRARLPAGDGASISELLARVAGRPGIRDIRIVEPNTDDIVREIYRTGMPGGAAGDVSDDLDATDDGTATDGAATGGATADGASAGGATADGAAGEPDQRREQEAVRA